MTLLGEQGRGDRRIDTARHGYDDAHEINAKCKIQNAKRCFGPSTKRFCILHLES
jgi:hypothetical protein